MKVNKIAVGLLLGLAIVLVPRLSISKDNDSNKIILSKNNVLVLNTEVDGTSVAEIIAKAKQLDNDLNKGLKIVSNTKPLYLFLNSPGGSIQSGLELIEALKGIDRPIHTITLFAASMAFQIAQNLDDRLILKNGVLMSHHAAGGFEGSFGGVQPSQVDSRYQLWLDRVKELDEQTVSRTNGKQTYESYTKQYDHEMWLTGTKSVQQGYADRVVVIKCDLTLSGVTTHHINFLGLDIAYDLDNCPINTSPMNIHVAAPDGKVLTNEMRNEVETKFLSSFENKQKQVLPMLF
jgi:ATP-dependent Clp protease, protease subunit